MLPGGPDPESILVVEDDIELRDALVRTLSTICPSVRTASTLAEARRECTLKAPDVVLLDLGLPDGDGADLLRQLRGIADMPIIVLWGRTEEEEIVALLDAGADDFIIKPCGAGELLARVRGQIRLSVTSTAARSWAQIVTAGVEIDLIAQRVIRHGEPQRLTPTEWALLRALILHPGRALSPRDLWDLVWGREFGDSAQYLNYRGHTPG